MAKKTVVFDPVKNYVRKNLMKVSDETGLMTIPSSQKVDFQSAILRELIIKNGLDPDAIKTDNAMNEVMAFINQRTKQETGIMAASQGNVIDIKDKMPTPFDNIKEATKKGDFKGIANQVLRDPDIAREFMLAKKFPTRTAEGEEAIPLAMKAKFDEEIGVKNLPPRDYSVETLVRDFKKVGATDEDIQTVLTSGKAGQIPYVMDNYGMSFSEVIDTLKEGKPLIEGLAQGGRIGYKDGPEKPSRRKFLKIAGGLAALPIVGKFFKPAKVGTVAKTAPKIVTTAPVSGKPVWFDSLVNKVIREGDDVTKKFATKEREIVHTKKIDEDSTVTVTQDLDEGIVRVEYDSADNVFEDTVQLQYKKPLPDETNPNPQAEFTTAESGPVGRQVSPDDYDIDIDEVGGTSIKDLDSDVSKLKEYATGKGPTMREIVQNKKRRDKAQRITDDPEEQSDAVVRRQGEMLDYDGPDDFASGGIARMLGE